MEDRYTARFFKLEDVFGIAEIKEKDKKLEVPWYFNLDNWEEYCYYISSEERNEVKRPSKRILHYHEFSPIGGDNDDD